METGTPEGGAEAPQQLLITGTGDQPIVMSAEDAAQLFQQAGIQWDSGSGQVIIGDVQPQEAQVQDITAVENAEGDAAAAIAALGNAGVVEAPVDGATGNGLLSTIVGADETGAAIIEQGTEPNVGDVNDGTVLYIDPNDPQAAALLQQAGLTLSDVTGVDQTPLTNVNQDLLAAAAAAGQEFDPAAVASSVSSEIAPKQELITLPTAPDPTVKPKDNLGVDTDSLLKILRPQDPEPTLSLPGEQLVFRQQVPQQQILPKPVASSAQSASSIQVGPDQQQVFYSVTYEDGKTQQYMMLCPKEMDQNSLINTLVKQISADPTAKGKKTIRIQKPGGNKLPVSGTNITKFPPRVAEPRVRGRPPVNPVSKTISALPGNIGDILGVPLGHPLAQDISNIVDSTDTFESVATQDLGSGELMTSPESGGTRVYVRCFYCTGFRSTLNSETWEAILNHILPVCKEEIQTTFYGDLGKHFIRCVRMQVNGKQIVRSRTISGGEKRTPQCEVILTHSLVCRKTKKEFLVSNPDAAFVANLAKHIRMIQPGQGGRGNSLLCIFCNSPFTYEDYLRHIQPHLDPILATLSCFSGAYCAQSYESTIRATAHCKTCQEAEPADLRFLPCAKFSTEYRCLTKLQFAVECFRENYGDSGFMRLNTSNLAKCSVCKNPQPVYCAVFHITTNILGADGGGGPDDIDTTLSVCVNCQKQFINIVIKEQGFDDRLKAFQLRNMEQLCSCLRVILGQAKQVCEDRKVLLYTVDEAQNSAVHTVKAADVAQLAPVTKLLTLPEPEIVKNPVKAFFICDLCLFTVDLTSLVSPPSSSGTGNAQKNDMLLSVVLEHLIPHTESLMTVVASSAANRTINLKFEIMARVTAIPNHPGGRKIVLSLQKKFKSQTSALEIPIDKDEEKTMSQIRAGIKAERKQYISVRPSTASVLSNPSTPANATQLIDINKYVESQRGKLGILAQCGCNTKLLNAYTECRLCSKFCFPDFRLAGNPGIELCENCVETVLSLCLPSEPETLEIAEECLALRQERASGHRLVLASNDRKWLSTDGVAIIKKTVESFDSVRSDCGTFFSDALKQHLVANLKTCHNDGEITSAVTGFCVTDSFFATSKVHSEENKADEETAAALASLSVQIGMQIKQAASPAKPQSRQKQIEVKILSRKATSGFDGRGGLIRQGQKVAGRTVWSSNGMVIDLGTSTKKVITSANKTIHLPAQESARDEESVTAIKKFLDSTAEGSAVAVGDDLKVPSGVKITSAGKGVVNIRAISDAKSAVASSIPTTSKGRGGRIISSATPTKTLVVASTNPTISPASVVATPVTAPAADLDTEVEEGEAANEEALLQLEEEFVKEECELETVNGMGDDSPATKPAAKRSRNSKAEEPRSMPDLTPKKEPGLAESPQSEPRSKRQRKEKKIFDL